MLLKENDPTKLELAAFDKDGKQVGTGTIGTNTADVTKLQAGETVADGTYKVAFTDGTDVGPKVDAPGIVIAKADDGGTDTGTTTTAPSNKVGDATTGTASVG